MISFPEMLEKLISRKNLSESESFSVMREILLGQALPVQTGAFLTALRAKGETADEVLGFVRAIREAMVPVAHQASVLVDTCGTGGDGKSGFNISTASAFVVAGAGVTVAKHGNRSVSSRCGSADLLECVGVKIDMSRQTAENCLKEAGITFLFAPLYHSAMRHIVPVRKELGVRTVFNFLGPLLNPAGANAQIIGVARPELIAVMSQVLQKLNRGRKDCALILHDSGYDEIVLSRKAVLAVVSGGKIKMRSLSAIQFGMKYARTEILRGGSARENSLLLRDVLTYKEHPLHDIVVANSALALLCARGVSERKDLLSDFEDSLKVCVSRAREAILNGSAVKKLDALIEWSNK